MNVNRKPGVFPSINALSAQLSSYEKVDHLGSGHGRYDCPTNAEALMKKKPFPEKLNEFLKLIPGNEKCPDCDVRKEGIGPTNEFNNSLSPRVACLPWAK
jgi:hypothetical protein